VAAGHVDAVLGQRVLYEGVAYIYIYMHAYYLSIYLSRVNPASVRHPAVGASHVDAVLGERVLCKGVVYMDIYIHAYYLPIYLSISG